ncbi:MAG: hypothetical protein ACTHME_03755 [Candidatus Nitrosocosmicus sp.]
MYYSKIDLIGQIHQATKRMLDTNDEDKIFEYKHCLNFNGINIVFSEPDVIDRSIIIELEEIDDENRKTEEEILKEFNALRPRLLTFIFNILAKAITIKPAINIKKIPRMADFSIWGEAIARSLGYKENEFLKAYYNNIGFQNSEVIESNPLVFSIKKLVEQQQLTTSLIFEGTPLELLEKLNQIASGEKIDTYQREWPKDRKWVVKRINIIKTNLQKGLGIKISIDRNTKNNTSIIKIEKNISGISGEHNLSPENANLSPYFDSLSPVLNKLSPEENQDLSTNSINSGDTGYTGYKMEYSLDNEDHFSDFDGESDNINSQCINCPKSSDPRIKHNHPFYYCIEHPRFLNINLEVIESHLILAKDHKKIRY